MKVTSPGYIKLDLGSIIDHRDAYVLQYGLGPDEWSRHGTVGRLRHTHNWQGSIDDRGRIFKLFRRIMMVMPGRRVTLPYTEYHDHRGRHDGGVQLACSSSAVGRISDPPQSLSESE